MADNFDEVLFPVSLSFGAQGGPEYRTETVRGADGRETRNALRAQALRRYNAASGVRSFADLYTLLNFFEARRGRLRGFRWRDPFDRSSAGGNGVPGPFDQSLGTGDGSTRQFQLSKTYTSGGVGNLRVIRKPEAGSVRAGVGGRETAAFQVDSTSGMLTLSTPPAAGAAVTAGFYFHVPVRFDTDYFAPELHGFNAGMLPDLPVTELV